MCKAKYNILCDPDKMPKNRIGTCMLVFYCFYKSCFAIWNGSGCWDSVINQPVVNSKLSLLVLNV